MRGKVSRLGREMERGEVRGESRWEEARKGNGREVRGNALKGMRGSEGNAVRVKEG